MISHICPGPRCDMSILDARWCCQGCWTRLSPEAKRQINQRFNGSAEDHIAAVAFAISELTRPRRKTTMTTPGGMS